MPQTKEEILAELCKSYGYGSAEALYDALEHDKALAETGKGTWALPMIRMLQTRILELL